MLCRRLIVPSIPVLGRGLFWTIFPPSCGRIPASIMLHFVIVSIVIVCIMGMT
nr:MAG TPA: hypothetical protein [Inoviridae sp.]